MLCRAQQCQWLLSDKVANPHSRSVALNRPTFAQRWQCERFRATPGMVFFLQFYVKSNSHCSLQSGAHFADLISKMLRTCQFFPIFCKIELSLHSRVGSVRFGFVFQELVNFRFPVRFGSVPGNIIKKNGSVRFGFRFLTGLVSGS